MVDGEGAAPSRGRRSSSYGFIRATRTAGATVYIIHHTPKKIEDNQVKF